MIKVFLVHGQDSMSLEEIESHVAGKILECAYSDAVGCWMVLTQLSPIDEGKMRIEEARAKVQQATLEQKRALDLLYSFSMLVFRRIRGMLDL